MEAVLEVDLAAAATVLEDIAQAGTAQVVLEEELAMEVEKVTEIMADIAQEEDLQGD